MARRMTAILCAVCVLGGASVALATPKVERTDSEVRVTFDNGVTLGYAVRAGQLLGLNTATTDGMALKSAETLVRPVLVQEKGNKTFALDTLQLTDVAVRGEAVVLTCNVFATKTDETIARLFITKDGKPHMDFYLFPHLGLPSEVMKLATYQKLAEGFKPGGERAGTLDIVVAPVTENVGGFTWKGWKHNYDVALRNGNTLNCIRELSTWETQGQAAGNEIVALRYRGLGGLSEKLAPLAGQTPGGPSPIKNAFTTTEILPGAAGQGYAVSPVVPGPQNIAGREAAMVHRHGAWNAQPQRGAGSPFFDFQFRPGVGLTSFYERMDSIRTVTEAWPGDTQVSYTDCLYFSLSDKHATPAKVHMALVPKTPLVENEWRTRYQEMDQFVRDLICKELKYVQSDPLPTVGLNWDSSWEWRIKSAANNVPLWKAAGVKRVITHHPGWFNGRGLRQNETSYPIPQRMITDPKKPNEPATMQNDTGGDCSIHDYVPQSEKVRDLWKQFAHKLNDNDMEYMVWITGMVYGTGPVVGKFGEKRFCINDPGVDYSSGYPGANGRAGHRNIPIMDPEIRAWWEGRMDDAVNDLGVSGFWADSYQNLFMSTMNYQMKDWSPNTRAWWEWIAAESRKGIAWMSESHTFPGLSCSIEAGDQKGGYVGEEWMLMYSTRWYRGQPVPYSGTEKADQIFFRTMANKGPIAPGDGDTKQIPEMGRLSAEYMAALPRMNRPYQLPDNRGVLWLSFTDDKSGVLFPFVAAEVPAGVKAQGIVTKADAPKAVAFHTLVVTGEDLLKAYGLQRGDKPDPRLGVKYVPPLRYIKKWSD